MIGSSLLRALQNSNFEINSPSRKELDLMSQSTCGINEGGVNNIISAFEPDLIINLAGIVRQKIGNLASKQEALIVNSVFPVYLDQIAGKLNIDVISIATDCVFSGAKGGYVENSPKDGSDFYAATKIMCEELTPNTSWLRTSVVGKGKNKGVSLLEWFLSQPNMGEIDGYDNHIWNGVTANSLAKVIVGAIEVGQTWNGVQHFLPLGKLTKFELLSLFKIRFGRDDLIIRKIQDKYNVDRSLATLNPQLNNSLWSLGGFQTIPTIIDLVEGHCD